MVIMLVPVIKCCFTGCQPSCKTQFSIDLLTNKELQYLVRDRFYIPDVTMHQLSWMWNLGHQFHEQIWTVFMQLYFHRQLGTNEVKLLFFDYGCKTSKHPSLNTPLTVMSDVWHPVNQFFLHLFANQTASKTTILRIAKPQCRSSIICFRELIVGSSQDDRFDRSDFGISSLRPIRHLVRSYLQLESMTIAAKRSKPIRITIISRLDSRCRLLLNAHELIH